MKILRVKIFENYFFDFTKKSKVRKSQNYRYIRSYKHSCRILRYLGYFCKNEKSKIKISKNCTQGNLRIHLYHSEKSKNEVSHEVIL